MDTAYCPECGIKIYGRNGGFTCPIHGYYKHDWVTGELKKECRCDECCHAKERGKYYDQKRAQTSTEAETNNKIPDHAGNGQKSLGNCPDNDALT